MRYLVIATVLASAAPLALAQPSAVEPAAPPACEAAGAPSADAAPHYLTVGAIAPLDHSVLDSARATVDVWSRGGWTLGVSALIAHDRPLPVSVWDDASQTQVQAVLYVAYPIRFGGWALVPSAGAGIRWVDFDREYDEPLSDSSFREASITSSLVAEASLVVRRSLGTHLAIEAGPVVTESTDASGIEARRTRSLYVGLGWAL